MSDLLCHGCLSSGRKLQLLNDFTKTQSFLQILSEIRMCPPTKSVVSICWECEALLARFIKFKKQVQYSYSLLNDCIANKINLTQIEKQSNLQINTLDSINIVLDNNKQIVEEIKLEKDVLYDEDNLKKEEPPKDDFNVCAIEFENDKHDFENDYNDFTNESNDFTNERPNFDNERLHDLKNDGLELENEEHLDDSKNVKDLVPIEVILKTKKKTKKSPKKFKRINVKNGNKKTKKKRKTRQTDVCRMIVLTPEDIEAERKKLANSEVYANSSIKCDKCILAFANVDDLQDHISEKHDKQAYRYKCDICECVFINSLAFNYHSNKHYKRYKCIVCHLSLTTPRAIVRHYNMTHTAPKDYYSQSTKLDNPNELEEESSNMEESNENSSVIYPCDMCDKVFKWKTSLVKHVELHRIQTGEKRRPFCEPCGLTFATTSNLQKHCKTSAKHQIQLQLNKLPDLSAARIDKIKLDVATDRSRFPCPHCDKRFQWRGNLLRHLQSLEAKAQGHLHCAPCSRTFSSIATYNQHMKLSKKHISENQLKYTCDECGKKFPNKIMLKDHVDWDHLKNFVHKCSTCEKVFKSHTSLYLHKMIHKQGIGGHLCDQCGRSFSNQNKLRTHVTAVHTSEQPFKCRLCTATFSWHSCLSRHVKVVHHKVKVKRKNKTETLH